MRKSENTTLRNVLSQLLCLGLTALLLTGCGFSQKEPLDASQPEAYGSLGETSSVSDPGPASEEAAGVETGDGQGGQAGTDDGQGEIGGGQDGQGGASPISPWWDKHTPDDYKKLDFDAFLEQLFEDSVAEDTLTLHFFLTDPEAAGITPGPANLGLLEATEEEEILSSIEECRQLLDGYSREDMNREQRITADILSAYLDACELEAPLQYYYEPFQQVTGLHTSLPYSLAEYEFYDRGDVEDYLTLLSQVDDYYASAVDWEKARAEKGLFMSDAQLDTVLKECQAYLWDGESDFFLQESFAERLENLPLSAEEKETLIQRDDAVLSSDFVAGYELLIQGLEALRGSGKNEKGLYYLPQGQAYYEYLIQANIGMTYPSVEELQDAVASDIDQTISRIQDILYGSGEDLSDEFLEERVDSRTPEAILKDLRARIAEDFPEIADSAYRVKTVSASMEDMMNPAFFMIPPLDQNDQNVIYINQKKLSSTSYDLFTVLAHEGYPGHLYQNAFYKCSPHSNFRGLMQYMGYSEGWGTYAELYSYSYMEDLSEPLREANRLMARLNLALSAFLDIAIHYDGWDLEETYDFCREWIGIDSWETVEELYNYVVSDPAGYLNYYVGYLEIQNLADRAAEELGDAFEIKEFHRFLLEMGPAPFTVIGDYFEEWLEG